jgi:uncharacterized protein (DUF1499 family)
MTFSSAMIGAALLAAGIAAAVFLVGLERVWALFGPADLGPVAFETLERRSVPNDALACPPGVCHASSDLPPPVYAVGADALKAAMARVIASEPDVTAMQSTPSGDRYVQRTRLMRFPDTIEVRYIPRGEGQSTIALYSRSQLGEGDMGVNRARIARWLDKLSTQAPVVR